MAEPVDRAELDHLVVAATSLAGGRAWSNDVLGVEPTTGGSHDGLGTHNLLVPLGGRRYLEVIAVDPDAPAPRWPRWFGLDTDAVHERIAAGPVLLAWVARCSGSDDAIERLSKVPGYGAAVVRAASRGSLRWRFAFTPDGTLRGGGVVPHLIQWDSEVHPTDRLPAAGLALRRLDLAVPDPAGLEALLAAVGLDGTDLGVVAGPAPKLVATLIATGGESVVLD